MSAKAKRTWRCVILTHNEGRIHYVWLWPLWNQYHLWVVTLYFFNGDFKFKTWKSWFLTQAETSVFVCYTVDVHVIISFFFLSWNWRYKKNAIKFMYVCAVQVVKHLQYGSDVCGRSLTGLSVVKMAKDEKHLKVSSLMYHHLPEAQTGK